MYMFVCTVGRYVVCIHFFVKHPVPDPPMRDDSFEKKCVPDCESKKGSFGRFHLEAILRIWREGGEGTINDSTRYLARN